MADKIPCGAFVIRNRHSMTVLHIESATLDSNISRVIAFEQDENRYHDNQIWWIEPLAHQDRKEGTLYSITNTACGKILSEESERDVRASKPHGSSGQAWRIARVTTDDEGVAYTILGTRTAGGVIGIKTPAIDRTAPGAKRTVGLKGSATDAGRDKTVPKPDAAFHTQKHIPGEDRQCWELVIPAVSSPVGWFQIQNFATGDLLSHHYLHGRLMLLPPPDTPCLSQYRESWATQWTLAQVETIKPSHEYTGGKNTWYVRNRLTEGRLINYTYKTGEVVAQARDRANIAHSLWRLELDPASNWTIMNHRSSLLLEQPEVPNGDGTVLVCVNKRYNPKLRNRSWVFRPPAIEKNDEVPRTYKAGPGPLIPELPT